MSVNGGSVGERRKNLKGRLAEACGRSGRTPDAVTLIAVSKMQSVEQIEAAAAEGQVDFGENYVQEAGTKCIVLHGLQLRWHFIGRIQSNKVKNLVGRYYAIHSVDRLSIAQQLNRLCSVHGVEQRIFLQFNVSDEESKGGAGEQELLQLFDFTKSCSHLRLLGLMVMPPMTADPELNRPFFHKARATLVALRSRLSHEEALRHPWNELSMGTSSDFEVAIEEGATCVRVGTEFFGPRPARTED